MAGSDSFRISDLYMLDQHTLDKAFELRHNRGRYREFALPASRLDLIQS